MMIKDELDKKREEIDQIDVQLVALLEKRMEVATEIGKIKKKGNIPVLDKERENQILISRGEMVNKKENSLYIKCIFKNIMKESRLLQEEKRCDV